MLRASAAFISLTLLGAEAAPSVKRKPHILFLLADDMGFANIGFHRRSSETADEKQGQLEVQTPFIDSLADEGIILERHYSYKICGPARSALLSGRLAAHVQTWNHPVTVLNATDPISGYSGIPRNMTGMGDKMKAGGYKTHYVGKWDAGMATPEHTPRGRGFDESFVYFQHANDYWNKKTGVLATGDITACLNAFYDIMVENASYRGPFRGPELTDRCQDSEERTPACYEEKMFEEKSLEIIRNHNASDEEHPLFLFHAFHLLHTPLQVPKYYVKQVSDHLLKEGGRDFDSENRHLLMAMTHYLDDTIKNLTDAIKAKGMWENTLVVFTSDNGGPLYEPGSSNNYPLRGGKFTDFDGGVRTNTFLSGGYIPQQSRGRIHDKVVSVADWYTIFSELADVDPTDHRAAQANKWLAERGLSTLPAVDGQRGMLTHIFAGTDGRREPLFLSANALLDFPYKLITGKMPYDMYTGPLYPNCSTVQSLRDGKGPAYNDGTVFGKTIKFGSAVEFDGDCAQGCLFNVEKDPSETTDLARDPAFQPRMEKMLKELARMNTTIFEPGRGTTHVQACHSAMFNGGGHFGPFAHIEGYYTDKPRRWRDLSLREMASMASIAAMETPALEKVGQLVLPKVFWHKTVNFDKCYTKTHGAKHSKHDHFTSLVALNEIELATTLVI